ncbi:MAG: histidinol-phosphate transaminase [Spirochaetes bacterium GWF1_41_5]|nr:MAG: histidinol-phosphate transaminase [Spirochaetes bacterium GWF1_41_5]HBE02325.1 histidinol-phosphate transaminase [Spirochaetia bacterium]
MKFWNNTIKKLSPYVYGEQPRLAARTIKLNTNENPYPPHPSLKKILTAFNIARLRYYPPPDAEKLVKAVSRVYKIKSANIFIGNGSDEILSYVFRAFAGSRDKIVFTRLTYSLYQTLAAIHGFSWSELPMLKDLSVDLDALPSFKPRIFFLANPNTPTGIALSAGRIEKTVKKMPDTLFIIDEAYADFNNENCIHFARKFNNVLIIRTLSKSYSLCGIRMGFAFGHADLISGLMKIKDSYNTSILSQQIAIHAFRHKSWHDANCRKVIKTRGVFSRRLLENGFLVLKSSSNFVMCTHLQVSMKEMYYFLKKHDIHIRYFDSPALDRYVRISIGTDNEMEKTMQQIKKFLKIKHQSAEYKTGFTLHKP